MESRLRTTIGKIKVNLAFDPQVHHLLVDMASGPKGQARFLDDLVLAEAKRRRQEDMHERLRAVEEQVATLMDALSHDEKKITK